MINNLPTIFEVVAGTPKKQTKEKTPNSSSKNNKSSSKTVQVPSTFFFFKGKLHKGDLCPYTLVW